MGGENINDINREFRRFINLYDLPKEYSEKRKIFLIWNEKYNLIILNRKIMVFEQIIKYYFFKEYPKYVFLFFYINVFNYDNHRNISERIKIQHIKIKEFLLFYKN